MKCPKCGKEMIIDMALDRGSKYIKPVIIFRCTHCDGTPQLEPWQIRIMEEMEKDEKKEKRLL